MQTYNSVNQAEMSLVKMRWKVDFSKLDAVYYFNLFRSCDNEYFDLVQQEKNDQKIGCIN